jgi:5-methylcytosine-specific restriction endonuclease McrA
MKRVPLKKIGKKGKEWQKARRGLVKDLKQSGEYKFVGKNVFGICPDCGCYRLLTPDHKVKRSQGGEHTKNNIEWVCLKCHDKRDNMGDPKQKKPKSNKSDWQRPHLCKKCKRMVSTLICSYCGEISI